MTAKQLFGPFSPNAYSTQSYDRGTLAPVDYFPGVPGESRWAKVGAGLVAIVYIAHNGGEYIKGGDVYGVEMIDGEPYVIRYRVKTKNKELPAYSREYVKLRILSGHITRREKMSYSEFRWRVTMTHSPDLVPQQGFWWMQYGIEWDYATHTLNVPDGFTDASQAVIDNDYAN